tara:strand:- start:20 stop:211 length:192 start_codon:yes stop_codon:yes gene_type:complete
MSDDRFGGSIIENIINNALSQYGITPKDIEKVKSIVDKIEVSHVGESTIIEINLKKLKIVIDS